MLSDSDNSKELETTLTFALLYAFRSNICVFAIVFH